MPTARHGRDGGPLTTEALLTSHCWHPHPHFVGLWRRDGGEYVSTAEAMRIESAEARGRGRTAQMRAGQGEEADIRKEILDRRRYHDNRVGPGRVEQRRYRKDWGDT